MHFSEIFKKSFMEGYAGAEMSTTSIVIALAITCILAVYIFFVYRTLTRKTFFSKNFAISLVGLSIITAAVIITIQSSIVVSLGMVGALSIVRFRTAIKEPMDLVFLFWSISIGIICGAGLAEIAVIASVIITIILYVLDLIPVAKAPMILVINSQCVDGISETLLGVVAKYSKYNKVKSRNITGGQLDMVLEIKTSDDEALVNEISKLENVNSVSLLSHDGEVTF